MIVTIHNDQLTLTADTLGAQMESITSYKGTEYLWNGDERYWKGRAPVLFPFVARLKDKTYTVINMKSMTDAMNLMTSMMTSLLVGIASIALVVGGIGIMNMMLVTVTERTTEIGLRKALGAEPGQIQMQFLIEAIILSLLGGVIGVVVGLGVSLAICMNTDITFSLNTFAIWLGVGFSAAVGIIFGWAPARKASRLNPIDALRSM